MGGRGSSSGLSARGGGGDITGSWQKGNYASAADELDAVIRKQGFNGKPSVASEADFEKAVSKSGYVMVRGVNASTAADLERYSNELRYGDFYYRGAGGRTSGEGLYAAGGKGTTVTANMLGMASGGANGAHGRIEYMTFKPGAKVIDKSELSKRYYGDPMSGMSFSEAVRTSPKKMESLKKKYGKNPGKNKFGGINSYAAALGYDAVDAGNGEMVILNRTKLIIRGKK